MPNRDKTGPQGKGPMTGRGLGACNKGSKSRFGLGFGRGRGLGFGRCCARGAGRWNVVETEDQSK